MQRLPRMIDRLEHPTFNQNTKTDANLFFLQNFCIVNHLSYGYVLYET